MAAWETEARDPRGRWAGYHVKVTLKRGYELPDWHKPDHGTLESAQAEVTKLRQWDGGTGAIQNMVINEKIKR